MYAFLADDVYLPPSTPAKPNLHIMFEVEVIIANYHTGLHSSMDLVMKSTDI